jgi:hypothetical protein
MRDLIWHIDGASTNGSHVDIKAGDRGTAVCNGVPIRAATIVVEEHNAELGRLREAVQAHLDILSGKITGGVVSPTLVAVSALDLKRLIGEG